MSSLWQSSTSWSCISSASLVPLAQSSSMFWACSRLLYSESLAGSPLMPPSWSSLPLLIMQTEIGKSLLPAGNRIRYDLPLVPWCPGVPQGHRGCRIHATLTCASCMRSNISDTSTSWFLCRKWISSTRVCAFLSSCSLAWHALLMPFLWSKMLLSASDLLRAS